MPSLFVTVNDKKTNIISTYSNSPPILASNTHGKFPTEIVNHRLLLPNTTRTRKRLFTWHGAVDAGYLPVPSITLVHHRQFHAGRTTGCVDVIGAMVTTTTYSFFNCWTTRKRITFICPTYGAKERKTRFVLSWSSVCVGWIFLHILNRGISQLSFHPTHHNLVRFYAFLRSTNYLPITARESALHLLVGDVACDVS